ncbi:mitochondrial tRNA methylthiotransferase CDK5RAP1 [Parasteatoda tepidariorum]|uniref:mitochondrial tRNA methylthiotransferase CDK5RAP1 n=1 Tax=Parasteatoda tepidariorum TaxID=114398 RepID=UPI001C721B14|nr:mitochondrial tRNA methylthiotransferase CDK5RAP1 [Parasteatoda tepidariorum]
MFRPSKRWHFSLQLLQRKLMKKCSYCPETKSPNIFGFKEKLSKGPSLASFIDNTSLQPRVNSEYPPYISPDPSSNNKQKVYIETYGCQMNVSDTEVIYAILEKEGYEISRNINDTNTILVMTCSIREGAEQKIWNRLKYFRQLKHNHDKNSQHPMKIGVLGCMAERLKRQLLEKEKIVDIIAGPDSYKDLPNLLSQADEGQKAVNIMLSVDETYADIMPVRINPNSKSAFVSIMRGCDNLCSYCIVPFTRGRERSRPISSIVDEVKHLSDQGVKEVTLLGQNVNSYRDLSVSVNTKTVLSSGFKTEYKKRKGGLRFADLLDKVSDVNPEMRIRFTSPHPKDFPDEVLHLINEKPNICKLIHLPAQSGNNSVLENMKRGYTREAYLELVDHIKNIIPDVALTSDFICGFCDESEDAHKDTISLMKQVKYEFAYIFAYSMREKTIAHKTLIDNVPEDVKKQRADEAYTVFRECALELHSKEIGNQHLVQVIGPSKRSELDWSGRNDWNTKVIYPQIPIPVESCSDVQRLPTPGDYIVVEVMSCSSQVLKGKPLYHTTLQNFYADHRKKYVSYN